MLTEVEDSAPPNRSFKRLQKTVQRLMPHWDQAPEDFRYLEGGYTNENYVFSYASERFVLRCQQPNQPRASGLASEVRFRALLKKHAALPIAPLIAADVTCGDMITGFVEGPLLAGQKPSPEQTAAYLRHLHQQLAYTPVSGSYNLPSLVNYWLPQPPPWLHHYLKHNADWSLLTEGPLQCCHNDLNPWNILLSSELPHAWTTLDWETAALAHPIFDVVTMHQGLAAEQAASSDAVVAQGIALSTATLAWPSLAEFCAQALALPVSAALTQAALRSYWLREYAWAAAQLRQGSENPAIAAQERLAQQQLQCHLRASSTTMG